jgi:ethanolamine utilization protein EutN
MTLCRVEGHVTATKKHASFQGWRLLVCQPIDLDGRAEGGPVVALDSLGAGLHENVVVSTDGSGARLAVGDPLSPARMMVVGIVDEITTEATR